VLSHRPTNYSLSIFYRINTPSESLLTISLKNYEMARTNETATVLTSSQNNANYSMTQSSWSFLFNDISPVSDGQLNFRGICCCIIGLVSIGCQAALMSKLGNG
jgi:hypothetical protein